MAAYPKPTHTRSAHTLDEPARFGGKLEVRAATRESGEVKLAELVACSQCVLYVLYRVKIRLPRATRGYNDRRLPSTRSSNARPSGRRGLLATRVVARLSPCTELLLAQKEWYKSESKMLASRTRANCVALGS